MSAIKKFTILDNDTIWNGMNKLDQIELKILFVVNEKNHLVGTLTDGDIRRALLKGNLVTDFVNIAMNKNPVFAKNIDEAKFLYNKCSLLAIPIIGDDGGLIGIHFDNNSIIRKVDVSIPVVINAGGKGTRLYPYTKILPKPLIPIGDVPIIEHIMNRYLEYGCGEFHIIINYKKEIMKAYFHENEKKYNISWYEENSPLGTGGGLFLLKNKIHNTFFFANCDTLINADYESAYRFHKKEHNAITIICAYKHMTIPYGVVEIEKNGLMKKMIEKPNYTYLTNTGMYIVEPEVIEYLNENEYIGFPDIIKRLIDKGKKVSVYPISENDFLDMGQLPELESMRQKLNIE